MPRYGGGRGGSEGENEEVNEPFLSNCVAYVRFTAIDNEWLKVS